MPDTVQTSTPSLPRPKLSFRKPARPHYLERGDPIIPASELDLKTLDLVDVEIWRQNKMWDRFERLRKEDPLHWTPDSLLGPYWSVTRYKDVMAIDSDHQTQNTAALHSANRLMDLMPPASFRQTNPFTQRNAKRRSPPSPPLPCANMNLSSASAHRKCSTAYPSANLSTGSIPFRSN